MTQEEQNSVIWEFGCAARRLHDALTAKRWPKDLLVGMFTTSFGLSVRYRYSVSNDSFIDLETSDGEVISLHTSSVGHVLRHDDSCSDSAG